MKLIIFFNLFHYVGRRLVLVLVHYCVVGCPSDVAVGWEVLVTWQKVFLGSPTVGKSFLLWMLS